MTALSAEAIADALSEAAAEQWVKAGGHILLRDKQPSALATASKHSFVLLQTATALDAAGFLVREKLRSLNAGDDSDSNARQKRPCLQLLAPAGERERAPHGSHNDEDDVSDGSALQGELIEKNVRPGKPQNLLSAPLLSAGNPLRAPDGSLRLVLPSLLSAHECQELVAGGLVAMAGAFSRCGQTTLGLSPALASRMLSYPLPDALGASHLNAASDGSGVSAADAASASIPGALPLLYRTVERVRRQWPRPLSSS